MHGVKTIGSRVARNAAGTADAGDKRNLMRWPPDVRQRAGDGGDDAKVTAAGTPDGFEVALEITGDKFGERNRFCRSFESSHDNFSFLKSFAGSVFDGFGL